MSCQTTILALFPLSEHWKAVKDGDPLARALFRRHYSITTTAARRDSPLFAGPGEKLVLLTEDANALFIWRRFRSRDGQSGINGAVFRNESPVQSSALIREAMAVAWARWPGERLFTYVNPRRIRSTNPGCCFKKAGWRVCGMTKCRHLLILEALPCSPSPSV